jgi:hypothetical protein
VEYNELLNELRLQRARLNKIIHSQQQTIVYVQADMALAINIQTEANLLISEKYETQLHGIRTQAYNIANKER